MSNVVDSFITVMIITIILNNTAQTIMFIAFLFSASFYTQQENIASNCQMNRLIVIKNLNGMFFFFKLFQLKLRTDTFSYVVPMAHFRTRLYSKITNILKIVPKKLNNGNLVIHTNRWSHISPLTPWKPQIKPKRYYVRSSKTANEIFKSNFFFCVYMKATKIYIHFIFSFVLVIVVWYEKVNS